MAPDGTPDIPDIRSAQQATGEYRDMRVRLLTRQLYAEAATAEVFGRSSQVAPTWRVKYLAAEIAFEKVLNRYLSEMKGSMVETDLKFAPVEHLKARGAILPDSSRNIVNSLQ